MSYIYKTGRAELMRQVECHAHFVRGRVLDVGAGSYARYKHLFNATEYVRMDIAAAEGVDVVGRIENIPLPDNSFDSIVCTQVVGDVFELGKAFAEMYRVLRPGGVLLLTESLFDPLHDEPHDYWRFTAHSLRRLAQDAHFKVEGIEPRGGYHSTMAQLSARHLVERLRAHQSPFARIISLYLKVKGERALRRDRAERSSANKLFPNGYLLIAKK